MTRVLRWCTPPAVVRDGGDNVARSIRPSQLGRFETDDAELAGRVGVLHRVCDRLAYRENEVIRFVRRPTLAGQPFSEQTASQGWRPEIYRQLVAKRCMHTQVPLQTPVEGPA